MASRRDPAPGGSSLLLSAMAGAALGAAGLGWWLLREAERRRQRPLAGLGQPRGGLPQGSGPAVTVSSAADPQLQDRVQQLNQAIDEVRRQLEQLQTRH